jgi:4-amino-4-deoxy-L-arabinose transferase-like glycosyltransferase
VDEPFYDTLAHRLTSGTGFTLETGEPTAWRTPGFPVVLGFIYWVTGGSREIARLTLASSTVFTALVVYWLCRMLLMDTTVALLAGLLWQTLLTTHRFAGLLMAEGAAALAFTLGLVLAVLAVRRNSTLLSGAAGALMGFCVLMRAYMLFAVLGPFLWLLIGKKKRQAAVYAVCLSVVLSGWMTRNYLSLGVFTISTEGPEVAWCGNNAWARGAWPGEWMREDSEQKTYMRSRHPGFDQLGEAERSRVFAREAVDLVFHQPLHILWLIPRKVAIFLSPISFWGIDWVYLALLPFSLSGIAILWRLRSERRNLWLMAFPIMGIMMVCILTFGDSRFRHPVDPLIAILSSLGIVHLARRIMDHLPSGKET